MTNYKKIQDLKSVLIVESDVNWGPFLKTYLEAKGFACSLAKDGSSAYETFRAGKHSFCLINKACPNLDGITLTELIRKKSSYVPIIISCDSELSEEECLKVLNAGADDILKRPYNVELLLRKILNALKRYEFCPKEEISTIFDLGNSFFDASRNLLYNDEFSVSLTTRETQLLHILCLNQDQILERDEALKAIWRHTDSFNARNMDVYISKLRTLLKKYTFSEILNVHGIGFRFIINQSQCNRIKAK